MLTLIGLLTICSLVVLLLVGRMAPILPLILVPLAGALLAGFGLEAITGFFTDGLGKVISIATMFVFAITFFGVLQDTGLFRPIIGTMVRLTRGNVIAVTVATALIGMLAHLDGAGATTFLLTIPALLPLYRKLGMSPYLMLLLLALGAGIFNMVPWAGPLGRAAAVTGIEVTELWRPLIAIQGVGVALLVALAVLLGRREQRRIASGAGGADAGVLVENHHSLHEPTEEERALERPGRSGSWPAHPLLAVVDVGLLAGAVRRGLGAGDVLSPFASRAPHCSRRLASEGCRCGAHETRAYRYLSQAMSRRRALSSANQRTAGYSATASTTVHNHSGQTASKPKWLPRFRPQIATAAR